MPTPEQLAGVYPQAAQSLGRNGKVVLACTVQTSGLLSLCSVVRGDPSGLGFGPAALSISPAVRMKPALKGGEAIEAEMTFAINFAIPAPPLR